MIMGKDCRWWSDPEKESFLNLISAQTYWPRTFEATLKERFAAVCLTEEWEKHWVIVRHDKQVDTGESGAGFKVPKWLSQVILLGAAVNKHLRKTWKVTVIELQNQTWGSLLIHNYQKVKKSRRQHQRLWKQAKRADGCVCEYLPYLPAHVWRLPFQDELGEWRRLQFILVKGKLVDHHGLTVHTGETHHGMCRARRLGAGDGDNWRGY